ncbi:MAG: lipocalin family protein [Flavobacteriaceae bacterium]|nr:lipocalin family protein [Flavobacteriaceae bacterium]
MKINGEEKINNCRSNDKIEVGNNATFTIYMYQDNASCKEQSNTGTWSKISKTSYHFTASGDTQTFTLSNNSLTFSVFGGSLTYKFTYSKE